MTQYVCNGANLMCTMGMAPSSLVVLPDKMTTTGGQPAANIADNKPLLNVMPFGSCMSLANPTVASATSAAMGVLTPMPCIPNIPAPWAPGNPKVMIKNLPAVNIDSKLTCAWGGMISVTYAGQATVSK